MYKYPTKHLLVMSPTSCIKRWNEACKLIEPIETDGLYFCKPINLGSTAKWYQTDPIGM